MKYFILSFFLIGLASCSFANPFSSPTAHTIVSNTGTTISSGTENIVTSGSILGNSGTEVITQNQPTNTTGNSGTITATGTKVPENTGTIDAEKDPEVQKITDDIDKIFEDIGKEGK